MIISDPSRFVVGKLCRHGHKHESLNQSLRYKSDNRCVKCKKIGDGVYAFGNAQHLENYHREYYQQHKEEIKDAAKRSYNKNRDRILLRLKQDRIIDPEFYKIKYQKFYKKHKERVCELNRGRYHTDLEYREYKNNHARKYNKTKRAKYGWRIHFHRLKIGRYRTCTKLSYDRTQLLNHFESFEQKCFYCDGNFDSIDHVVAISRGGTNDLNNLVPCCNFCNSSKNNKDVLIWYSESKNYNIERYKMIELILWKKNNAEFN